MFTDEMMQELHDDHFAIMGVEDTDSETITESDVFDCVHDGAEVFTYSAMQVWECHDCGAHGEVGREY